MAPAQPQLTTFFMALPRKGGLAAGVAKVGGRGRPAPPHRSPVPSRTPSPAPADGDAAGSDASLPQSSPANDALAPPPRVRLPIAARTFAAPKRRRGDAGPAGEPDAAHPIECTVAAPAGDDGEHGRAAATEHQPERADEFRGEAPREVLIHDSP